MIEIGVKYGSPGEIWFFDLSTLWKYCLPLNTRHYKVRNETETERNELDRNVREHIETNQNETKQIETERNETNEIWFLLSISITLLLIAKLKGILRW